MKRQNEGIEKPVDNDILIIWFLLQYDPSFFRSVSLWFGRKYVC